MGNPVASDSANVWTCGVLALAPGLAVDDSDLDPVRRTVVNAGAPRVGALNGREVLAWRRPGRESGRSVRVKGAGEVAERSKAAVC